MAHKTTFICATLTILLATPPLVSAGQSDRLDQDRAYGAIQAERERQRTLVEQGRSDGSITWLEKYALTRELARIDTLEREALADGRLSRDEYKALRRAQDDTTRHIIAERRDEQVRGWWWRLWR